MKKSLLTGILASSIVFFCSTFAATRDQECKQIKTNIKTALDEIKNDRPSTVLIIMLDRDCASRDHEYLRYVTEFSAIKAQKGLDEMDKAEGRLSGMLIALETLHEEIKEKILSGELKDGARDQAIATFSRNAYMAQRTVGNEIGGVYATAAMVENVNDYISLLTQDADIISEYERLGFSSIDEAIELEEFLMDFVQMAPIKLDEYKGIYSYYLEKVQAFSNKVQELISL